MALSEQKLEEVTTGMLLTSPSVWTVGWQEASFI